jgi:predicted secreted protein
MDITITRSGGIVGLFQKLGPVDTKTLPKELAGQVEGVIAKMDFFNLPANMATRDGADTMDYTTTVSADGRAHVVHSNDLSPVSYRSLLDQLIGLLEDGGHAFKPVALNVAPNKYQLSGFGERKGEGMPGIPPSYRIIYTPDGLELHYGLGGGSHAIIAETYRPDELRSITVPDLGTCVSFPSGKRADGTASYSRTLVIPGILLASEFDSAPVHTFMVNTSHSGGYDQTGSRQQQQYEVIALDGTATRDSTAKATEIEWEGQESMSAGVGDDIVIRLDENPSTGYRNTIDITGKAVVCTLDRFVPSPGGKVGAGGLHLFTVMATQPGTADVVLRYGRGTEETERERRVHVTVR